MGGIILLGMGVIHSWGQNNDKPVHLSLATSDLIYHQGIPVKFTLTVSNGTEDTVRISFSSSKQFDLVIKKDEKILWTWSEEKMFAMSLTQLKLDPGERKHFDIVWPQLDRDQKQVKPGFYRVFGWLASKKKLMSNSITFEIRS